MPRAAEEQVWDAKSGPLPVKGGPRVDREQGEGAWGTSAPLATKGLSAAPCNDP